MSEHNITNISGDPTDEEVAAIMAAIQVGWPRPSAAPAPMGPISAGWRFSGRWWAKPVAAVRARP